MHSSKKVVTLGEGVKKTGSEKTGDDIYGQPPKTIHLANHLSMKEPLVSEHLPSSAQWGQNIFVVAVKAFFF